MIQRSFLFIRPLLIILNLLATCTTFLSQSVGSSEAVTAQPQRKDGAKLIYAPGRPLSAQNPAFSPDGLTVLFTIFHNQYNHGWAGIYTTIYTGGSVVKLFAKRGHQTVNLPGSCWNPATNTITFASDMVNTDEIWTIAPDGSHLTRITHTSPNLHSIEPSFSPEGQWIVFEVDTNAQGNKMLGSIWKIHIDGTGLVKLSGGPGSGFDDRQPNWSPLGNSIVIQRRKQGSNIWNLYTMSPDSTNLHQVTNTNGSNTDASWSPDGQRIVYSSDYGNLPNANVFVIPVQGGTPLRVTFNDQHEEGAASWSPDGKWIVFESHRNGSDPAAIWLIPAPAMP